MDMKKDELRSWPGARCNRFPFTPLATTPHRNHGNHTRVTIEQSRIG